MLITFPLSTQPLSILGASGIKTSCSSWGRKQQTSYWLILIVWCISNSLYVLHWHTSNILHIFHKHFSKCYLGKISYSLYQKPGKNAASRQLNYTHLETLTPDPCTSPSYLAVARPHYFVWNWDSFVSSVVNILQFYNNSHLKTEESFAFTSSSLSHCGCSAEKMNRTFLHLVVPTSSVRRGLG